MCGLCSLVRRSQSLKKSELSVFDTLHLSTRIIKERSPLPAHKSGLQER